MREESFPVSEVFLLPSPVAAPGVAACGGVQVQALGVVSRHWTKPALVQTVVKPPCSEQQPAKAMLSAIVRDTTSDSEAISNLRMKYALRIYTLGLSRKDNIIYSF